MPSPHFPENARFTRPRTCGLALMYRRFSAEPRWPTLRKLLTQRRFEIQLSILQDVIVQLTHPSRFKSTSLYCEGLCHILTEPRTSPSPRCDEFVRACRRKECGENSTLIWGHDPRPEKTTITKITMPNCSENATTSRDFTPPCFLRMSTTSALKVTKPCQSGLPQIKSFSTKYNMSGFLFYGLL